MLSKLIHKIRTKRQWAYALAHQVLMGVYGLGLMLLLVRHASKELFGAWVLIASCFAIAEMIQQGFFQTIVVKSMARYMNHAKYARLLASHILTQSFLLSLLLCALIFILNIISKLTGVGYSIFHFFAIWYPAYALSVLVFNTSWWMQMGLYRFNYVFRQRLVYAVISVSIIAVQVFYLKHITLTGIMVSQIAGYASASLFILICGYIKPTYRVHLSRRRVKKHFDYGKFNLGTLVSSSLLRNADGYAIAAFSGQAAVAVYTLPQKITEFFELVLRTNATTLLPALAAVQHDRRALITKVTKKALQLVLAFLPFAILISIFSHQVIALLSKNAYPESAAILTAFMLYVLLLPIDRFCGVVLEAMYMPQLNFAKSIVITVVNVGGDILVLKYHGGLAGVALVSSVALLAGFMFIVVAYYSMKRDKRSY